MVNEDGEYLYYDVVNRAAHCKGCLASTIADGQSANDLEIHRRRPDYVYDHLVACPVIQVKKVPLPLPQESWLKRNHSRSRSRSPSPGASLSRGQTPSPPLSSAAARSAGAAQRTRIDQLFPAILGNDELSLVKRRLAELLVDKALAELLVDKALPYNIVDSGAFRRFVEALRPGAAALYQRGLRFAKLSRS